MQKVYLLLRSNKQTGPYTREELLELQLKPLDLVWVEGKSFGWSYPSEIESLKQFVETPSDKKPEHINQPLNNEERKTRLSAAVSKNIFVSMPLNVSNRFSSPAEPEHNSRNHLNQKEGHISPVDEPVMDHQALERKAEELRRRAQASNSSKKENDDVVEIKYAKTLEEVEAEYTSWIYQKKTKKKNFISKENLLPIIAVLIVVTSGWLIGNHLFNKKDHTEDQVVHVQNSVNENVPAIPGLNDEQNKLPDSEMVNQINAPETSLHPIEKKTLTQNKVFEKPKYIDNTDPVEISKTSDPYEDPLTEIVDEPVYEEERPKKRTLGESVNEVFNKLFKNEDEQNRKKEAGSKNERKATHRGDVTLSEVDISDQVEIKINNSNSDNWMMGVIGMKVTLLNQSAVALTKAEIEVLYFNDQNRLLDKKLVTFSNVASKKSQTIPLPDHRLADRAEVKIISATGIQDAYAKN